MKLFSLIERHPVRFFWLSILYMAVCSPACEVLTGSAWLHALVILPINLITWPVARALLGEGRWKRLHFLDLGAAALLPVISTALVILPLLWQ